MTAPAITISDAVVGRDLQTSLSGSLGYPAAAGEVPVTITSADPGKVILSASSSAAGSGSIVLTVPAGSSVVPSFYVQALDGAGSVQITASTPGYIGDTAAITLNPSGFYIFTSSFTTTRRSGNTSVRIMVALLNPATLGVVVSQPLRAGVGVVSVPVTSSDTGVGTISVNPLLFNGGLALLTTAFDPLEVGTTTITLGTPPGFSTPSQAQQITATVTVPAINLPDATVGRDLQGSVLEALGAWAPEGGVQVTITSADPQKLILSADPNVAGSGTIDLTVPAGSSAIPLFVQALGSAGTIQISASAPGFIGDTASITLTPSGFFIETITLPSGQVIYGDFTTTASSPNTLITCRSAQLNPTTLGLTGIYQSLRAGVTASLPVTSSDPGVGTITTSPLVFTGNVGLLSTEFDPQGPGTTTISLSTPPGISNPISSQQKTATVSP